MIYVVELPDQGHPRAWFAYDKEDFASKMVTLATPKGEHYVYWDEAEAVAAFEGRDPLIADKSGRVYSPPLGALPFAAKRSEPYGISAPDTPQLAAGIFIQCGVRAMRCTNSWSRWTY